MAEMVIKPRVREISATTGTSDYILGGAPSGFVAWSVIGAGNYAPYYATNGVDWEEGFVTYQSGPDRLERTVLRSSNSDAAVDWAVGNKTIRLGPSSVLDYPRLVSKDVAGGAGDVTLTPAEQRCAVLVLTGALTGARNVIVDDTEWVWPIVYNNTSGAHALVVKTAGGTGIDVTQGSRTQLVCDGTNVVDLLSDVGPVVHGSADPTKKLRIEVDGFTTATTRVMTPPNADFTAVGETNTQTLTNKTLTSPVINTQVSGTAVATSTDMEAASSAVKIVPPSLQHRHPGHPKSWGYATYSGGVPTLDVNYNMTSISDDGVGALGGTIATNHSSANYALLATPGATTIERTATEDVDERTSTAFRINCGTAAAAFADAPLSFATLGDQ